MKRPNVNVDEILGQVLHSTPQQEMENAGTRVLQRLRRESHDASEAKTSARVSAPKTWRFLTAAAAVAGIVVILIVFWPSGSAAIVEAADNGLYRIVGGKPQALQIGEPVAIGEIIRSDGASSAVLAVNDGSRIEMRSMSELALEGSTNGVSIRLNDGSVVVSAPKEAKMPLVVRTRDASISVVNTVSLVMAEEAGSRVAVIQGEARLQQNAGEKLLRSGEEATTNPSMQRLKSWKDEVSWSRLAMRGAPTAWLQPPATQSAPEVKPGVPKWEVVSIKPCDSNSVGNVAGARGNGGVGENFTVSPGRLSVNCMRVETLINLSHIANGERLLNDFGRRGIGKIRGGAEWVHSAKLSDRYSIEAKAEGTPDKAIILGPMLRALLEDRFQLKLHRETEEAPMYALVAAKGGPKIKPIKDDDCTPNDYAMGDKWLDQVRRGEKGFCNFVYGAEVGPATMGWAFGGHTMADFAQLISPSAKRLVIDQTGLTGRFRIYLEVDSSAGDILSVGDIPDRTPPAEPSLRGPDIFTALREQLGLQLIDAPKGPRQFIVIDHVERPSEN